MSTKIFLNLPVRSLDKSMAFFRGLGFTFNPQVTDDTAGCMVISDDIYAMLLTHEKFKLFTDKEIVDATRAAQVLICISRESREEVAAFVDKAVAGGASETRPPQDYGFMIVRTFDDLDGHTWEIMWMDPAHVQPA